MTAVRKNITITKAQAAFLKINNLNLSRVTQEAIRKRMDDMKFARATREAIRNMERGNYVEMELEEFIDAFSSDKPLNMEKVRK